MKRYIAFLDILGFKELVNRNDPHSLMKIYEEALNFADEKTFGLWHELPNLDTEDSKLKIMVISDSILIWTPYDDTLSFGKLLITVQSFLAACILNGLPLRGAIEVGEMEIMNWRSKFSNESDASPIVLGEAITKAFISEKEQEWAGCVISDESINTFLANRHENEDINLDNLVNSKLITQYSVPLKKGPIQTKYVVDWTIIFSRSGIVMTEEIIRNSFNAHNKTSNTWEIEMKIKNTVDFFKTNFNQ